MATTLFQVQMNVFIQNHPGVTPEQLPSLVLSHSPALQITMCLKRLYYLHSIQFVLSLESDKKTLPTKRTFIMKTSGRGTEH